MTLVETGTRGLLAAVLGPKTTGEITYASRLVAALDPTMLLLADRAFDGAAFMAQVHATGAAFCIRLRSNRRLPILAQLSDGSFLTLWRA
ncbi:MAG: transposase [Longispora sp.]|nr:transposase [Longispora sp. (in: high G+C Gram-positive bacteria)]